MFEKIRPLYDRVLVKRREEDTKTAGGLYIPDAAKDKAQVGEVVAAGEGRLEEGGKLTPLRVKKGDLVFFGKYSGTDANDEYVVLREDEVLGIIEK